MENHYWKGYDGNSTFYMIKNISSIPTPSLLDLSKYFASPNTVSKSTEITRSLNVPGPVSETRISVALGNEGNESPYAGTLSTAGGGYYYISIPIAFSEVYHFSDNATGLEGKELAEPLSSSTDLNLSTIVPNLSKFEGINTNLDFNY